MPIILPGLFGLFVISVFFLALWRQRDHRADHAEITRLVATQPQTPSRFSASMVAALPEPARRFLTFAITDGTPLYTVAEITMSGKFSLGSKDAPNYIDMHATQVLAAPHGFIWKMSGGSGLTSLSGSDSGSWTRFWLAGLLPVARLGNDSDHSRAAFGRCVAESVFWTPAVLLSDDVKWDRVDDDTVCFSITHHGISQSVEITIDDQGQPLSVAFQRWSNANPDQMYRFQPFGGILSEFREFQGFRVPTHVEAGNFFGTDDYFPFYIADVTAITFPLRDAPRPKSSVS